MEAEHNCIVDGGAFARAFDAIPREYLLPRTCWEPSGAGKGTNKLRVSKLKYTCPTCKANVWGKPARSLRCDDCDQPMDAEDLDDAGNSAQRAA